MGKVKNKVYAYSVEGQQGVARTWAECETRVKGFNARYKGFETEAAARAWLAAGAPYEHKAAKKREAQVALPKEALYFDSGTGRGEGTEIAVTDAEGVPLLHLVLAAHDLTPRGTHFLPAGATNNRGELTACLLAMRAARKLGVKKVCGDSALVLDYWSRGHVTLQKRREDFDLYKLAQRTAAERAAFEKEGGRLIKVPGALNPADLGFHRE
jgi:ribonuclease H-related protein